MVGNTRISGPNRDPVSVGFHRGRGRCHVTAQRGIDSPVAGYLAQNVAAVSRSIFTRRHCQRSEQTQGSEIRAKPCGPAERMRLHVVTFTHVQKAIREVCDPRLTVLLYRRFMYRIAAAVAKKAVATPCAPVRIFLK